MPEQTLTPNSNSNSVSLPTYRINDLLMVVDAQGQDTGTRCRFSGFTVDAQNQWTGEAHVVLLDRYNLKKMQGNVNIDLKRLQPADGAQRVRLHPAGEQIPLPAVQPEIRAD